MWTTLVRVHRAAVGLGVDLPRGTHPHDALPPPLGKRWFPGDGPSTRSREVLAQGDLPAVPRFPHCPQPLQLRRGWVHFRLSNGSVFDCQNSCQCRQVGTFYIVKWVCFRLTKTPTLCTPRWPWAKRVPPRNDSARSIAAVPERRRHGHLIFLPTHLGWLEHSPRAGQVGAEQRHGMGRSQPEGSPSGLAVHGQRDTRAQETEP